ncbi:glycosyltransferase family 2 protein [Sinomicrobium oceani]|uniref:glycosyltransferase family 2 protein n=1 Tax=Sinomicrobium oceani TaxID=1150368 RepID=UPI00227B3E2C|nr:glycosyltransferase [Sinomicrobium oceani]
MVDILTKILSISIFLLLILIIVKIICFSIIIFSYKKECKHIGVNNSNATPYNIDIIIAAYNEEKVIIDTVDNLLKIDYKNFAICIVNDGSTDNTLSLIEKKFNNHCKVKILSKKNEGKAEALNYAISHTTSEIVVFLDADTHVKPNILKVITRRFENLNVSALAGHLQVRADSNLLTFSQNIEYLSNLNFEREVFDKINTLTTIPGAICAYRRKELINIGKFNGDTLTEDCDLTMKFLKQGLKIKNEKKFIGYTEAPNSIRMFIRQRIRWNYGLLQNLINHGKHLTINKLSNRYKLWLTFSYFWIFKILYTLIFAFADCLFLITLIFGFKSVHYYYLFVFILETIITIFVLKKERTIENPKIYVFPLYKVIYRQLRSFSLIVALYKIVTREKLIWKKIQRYNTNTI